MNQRNLLLLIGGIIVLVAAAFGGGFYLGQSWPKPPKAESPTPPWLAKNPPPPPPKEEPIPEQRLTFYDNLTEKGGKTAKTAKPERTGGTGEASKTSPSREKAETKTKPTETTTAKEAAPTPQTKGNYIIHLASLKSQQGAESLAARLNKKGYKVSVKAVELGEKGTWYRLLMGGYTTKEEAERTAEILRKKEGLSPLVRPGRE